MGRGGVSVKGGEFGGDGGRAILKAWWLLIQTVFGEVGKNSWRFHTRSIENMTLKLTELIAQAPWREAITYRETWPHEYVLSKKDGQQELLDAICDRFRAGEGMTCRFFRMNNTYLFIGDYKYWLMTHWDNLEPEGNYVINRARLYRDRRDFVIQLGDTGKREDYPVNPVYQS